MSHDHANKDLGDPTVTVRFHLEDPDALTDSGKADIELKAAVGDTLLDLALNNGINIEHSCGGVCACSTCHIHVTQGMNQLSEAEEEEEDRVEEAPGLQINSRLACQCEIKGQGLIEVTIPAWNRNAVKEVPH